MDHFKLKIDISPEQSLPNPYGPYSPHFIMAYSPPNMPYGPPGILRVPPGILRAPPGMPNGSLGMPQSPPGMPNGSLGMPQSPPGMPNGSSEMPNGSPGMPNGFPGMPNGFPMTPHGSSGMPNGFPMTPPGFPKLPPGLVYMNYWPILSKTQPNTNFTGKPSYTAIVQGKKDPCVKNDLMNTHVQDPESDVMLSQNAPYSPFQPLGPSLPLHYGMELGRHMPALQMPALQMPALQMPALQMPALQMPVVQVQTPQIHKPLARNSTSPTTALSKSAKEFKPSGFRPIPTSEVAAHLQTLSVPTRYTLINEPTVSGRLQPMPREVMKKVCKNLKQIADDNKTNLPVFIALGEVIQLLTVESWKITVWPELNNLIEMFEERGLQVTFTGEKKSLKNTMEWFLETTVFVPNYYGNLAQLDGRMSPQGPRKVFTTSGPSSLHTILAMVDECRVFLEKNSEFKRPTSPTVARRSRLLSSPHQELEYLDQTNTAKIVHRVKGPFSLSFPLDTIVGECKSDVPKLFEIVLGKLKFLVTNVPSIASAITSVSNIIAEEYEKIGLWEKMSNFYSIIWEKRFQVTFYNASSSTSEFTLYVELKHCLSDFKRTITKSAITDIRAFGYIVDELLQALYQHEMLQLVTQPLTPVRKSRYQFAA